MKITISGNYKEIAALAGELQKQQMKTETSTESRISQLEEAAMKDRIKMLKNYGVII